MGEAKIDHLRVPAEHVHGDETVLWLPSFLSLESCCLEFAWNNHYHELGTERAISLIQVCVRQPNLGPHHHIPGQKCVLYNDFEWEIMGEVLP